MDDLLLKAHRQPKHTWTRVGRTLDAEEEDYSEDVEWPEDLGGPFCGCRTCEVRELLTAARPVLLEAARVEAGCSA